MMKFDARTIISKGIILVLILIVVLVFFTFAFKTPNREAVISSRFECVQSVCMDSKTSGELCRVIEPRVSEILIERSYNNPDIMQVRIIPSDDRCQ